MSKFVIYKAISPLGYPVEIMTDGLPSKVTYEKLFVDEEMRIMKIEATGAKVVKEVAQVPTPQKPLEATTQSQEKFCGTCGLKMTMRSGVGKTGKAWTGWFCSDKSHEPIWG